MLMWHLQGLCSTPLPMRVRKTDIWGQGSLCVARADQITAGRLYPAIRRSPRLHFTHLSLPPPSISPPTFHAPVSHRTITAPILYFIIAQISIASIGLGKRIKCIWEKKNNNKKSLSVFFAILPPFHPPVKQLTFPIIQLNNGACVLAESVTSVQCRSGNWEHQQNTQWACNISG